jgi:hypothetical protein
MEQSFRMTQGGLRARPVFHQQREAIANTDPVERFTRGLPLTEADRQRSIPAALRGCTDC